TASPVSGSCWKNCACTWRGAGSPGWGSSRGFPITRRSRRTGMAAFRSRTCFRSCLSALWSSASPRVWWRASRCRSMAASSRRTMGVEADNTYGNGELLQWLDDRGITPYIRVKEGPNSPPDLYGIEKFTYVPEENCYLCPAGKPLNYVGINKRNRAHRYYSTV